MKTSEGGYTLIELMIVIAIIGVLAAVCIPVAGDAIARTKDATTRGNLATLRAALALYYTNTEGGYPGFPAGATLAGYGTVISDALVPLYISRIPEAMESGGRHQASNLVAQFWNQTGQDDDEAAGMGRGWRYNANSRDFTGLAGTPAWGSIMVLCNHKDLKGMSWTSY